MISPVGPNAYTATISSVSLSVTSSTSGTGVTGGTCKSGDRADISGPGKLFSELKQLASQDPAKFKEVAADIAAKLKAAASGDSSNVAGGVANSFLTDLAVRFDTAAQTGDVSGLQPSGGGHHHHHHHHGQVSGYNQQGQAVQSSHAAPPMADLKPLFDSVNKEVTDALASLGTPISTPTA